MQLINLHGESLGTLCHMLHFVYNIYSVPLMISRFSIHIVIEDILFLHHRMPYVLQNKEERRNDYNITTISTHGENVNSNSCHGMKYLINITKISFLVQNM